MKKILVIILSFLMTSHLSFGQNNFPTSGDAYINSSIPTGHGSGYNALWMPNANALMPENNSSFSGIYLTSNVIRNSSSVWSFANSSLPAWSLYIGNGSSTDYFSIGRSAPTTYAMQTYFRVINSGNVGIGTTSPVSKLQVMGAFIAGGTSSNLDPTGSLATLSNSLANSGQMLIGWNRTGAAGENDFIANQGPGGTGGVAFYNHDNSNNETQLMWILASGNVLIGKTTQGNSSYRLDVGGNVRANSITVNTNGADFVFEPAYKLHPLAFVEQYIFANHHLPGIASAKEMQVNGLNLGENQTALLQKVEELTLYLIDKDKQITEQQALNRKQASTNETQQKTLETQQQEIDELKKQVTDLLQLSTQKQ